MFKQKTQSSFQTKGIQKFTVCLGEDVKQFTYSAPMPISNLLHSQILPAFGINAKNMYQYVLLDGTRPLDFILYYHQEVSAENAKLTLFKIAKKNIPGTFPFISHYLLGIISIAITLPAELFKIPPKKFSLAISHNTTPWTLLLRLQEEFKINLNYRSISLQAVKIITQATNKPFATKKISKLADKISTKFQIKPSPQKIAFLRIGDSFDPFKVKTNSNDAFYLLPSLSFLNSSVQNVDDMINLTMKKLGFESGRGLLRISFIPTDETPYEISLRISELLQKRTTKLSTSWAKYIKKMNSKSQSPPKSVVVVKTESVPTKIGVEIPATTNDNAPVNDSGVSPLPAQTPSWAPPKKIPPSSLASDGTGTGTGTGKPTKPLSTQPDRPSYAPPVRKSPVVSPFDSQVPKKTPNPNPVSDTSIASAIANKQKPLGPPPKKTPFFDPYKSIVINAEGVRPAGQKSIVSLEIERTTSLPPQVVKIPKRELTVIYRVKQMISGQTQDMSWASTGDEVYSLTPAEFKASFMEHKKKQAQENMLQTTAMREANKTIYKKCLIRLVFPPRTLKTESGTITAETIVQIMFHPTETLSKLYSFVKSKVLKTVGDFHLFASPPLTLLPNIDGNGNYLHPEQKNYVNNIPKTSFTRPNRKIKSSLEDHGLAPASLIYIMPGLVPGSPIDDSQEDIWSDDIKLYADRILRRRDVSSSKFGHIPIASLVSSKPSTFNPILKTPITQTPISSPNPKTTTEIQDETGNSTDKSSDKSTQDPEQKKKLLKFLGKR